MIVRNDISSLWLDIPMNISDRLNRILDAAPRESMVFFRADDVAVPGKNMARMLEIFRENNMPLCMAVVPAWLHRQRWAELHRQAGDSSQWCWHQHGWRHRNHQSKGKKGEFGNERAAAAKKTDLAKGRERLTEIMGSTFQPFFTPPWNRFDEETGHILRDLDFTGVSRSAGELKKVPLPEDLPDLFINVDLHTRNEACPAEGWGALLKEFEAALATGRCGIMLHHQRANTAAFDFLDLLLKAVATHDTLRPITFADM